MITMHCVHVNIINTGNGMKQRILMKELVEDLMHMRKKLLPRMLMLFLNAATITILQYLVVIEIGALQRTWTVTPAA